MVISILQKPYQLPDFIEADVKGRTAVEVRKFSGDVGMTVAIGLLETLGPSTSQAATLKGVEMGECSSLAQDASNVAPLPSVLL